MSYQFENVYSAFDRYIDDKLCTIGVMCEGVLHEPIKGSWNPEHYSPDIPADLEVIEIKFHELIMYPEDLFLEEYEEELKDIEIDDLSEEEYDQLCEYLHERVCEQADEEMAFMLNH